MQKIPEVTREGKYFRVPGRQGLWKYIDGKRKPVVTKTDRRNHLIVRVPCKGGRRLTREVIRIRKYQIADDGMILDLLRGGRIRVDPYTGRVFSLVQTCWRELSQYENRDGGYLFVRLYQGEFRKKIAVHRLIMMADMDSEIPAGFDVDHRNKNFRDNRLENLRLLAAETNRCTNLSTEEF